MSNLKNQFDKIIGESKYLEVEEIKQLIGDLMGSINYYSRGMLTSFAPSGMYRARFHNYKYGNKNFDGKINRFKNENEFWNPPAYKCSLGRCNDTKQSILYCTNDAETAILEVKPPKKGYISLSVFHPKSIRGSRAIFIGEKTLSKVESIHHLFKNDIQNPQIQELDSFLDKLFYSTVNEDSKYLYKISTAVTQLLMSNIVDNNGKQKTIQALLYTSLAKNHTSFNFVLRPNHAINLYRLIKVQTLQILENTDSELKLKLVSIGQPISNRKKPLNNPKLKWFNINNGEIWTIKKLMLESN